MLQPFRHRSNLNSQITLPPLPTTWRGKIAYLDRDGVINYGSENYINSVDELVLLPNIGQSIGKLRRKGFRICVVTNQSPIGRNIWGHENLAKIHDYLSVLLLEQDSDAFLDLILYSPYAPWEGSWARKPNPGMLEAGRQIMQIGSENLEKDFTLSFGHNWKNQFDESKSVMVGDRDVDMEAARKFGVRGIKCNPEEGLSGVINQII
tara:strand:- start:6302 stop:6922 length:621 start_codon:yes stop_codon:yes gene_type:complete